MALADWSRKVSNALDQALAEHIVLTQSKLAQACPKDTVRMASSFYVGKEKPDLQLDLQICQLQQKENIQVETTEGVIIPPDVTKVKLKALEK